MASLADLPNVVLAALAVAALFLAAAALWVVARVVFQEDGEPARRLERLVRAARRR